MAYRGITARLPIGAQGFTGTRNQSQAGPGHFIYVEGAELDAGIIRKDGGAVKIAQIGALTSHRSILHFTGPDAGTVFPDASPWEPGAEWTATGDAKLSTTAGDFKFGPSGLVVDGVGDKISTPDYAGLDVLSQEFTVHFWFKTLKATGILQNVSGQTDSAQNNGATSIVIKRTTGNFMQASVGQLTSLVTLTGNVQYTDLLNPGLHHFALGRDNVANLLRLFVDGVQQASIAITGQINNSADPWSIGNIGSVSTDYFHGAFDEHVIVIGNCLWRANFTPPAKPSVGFGNVLGPGDTEAPIIAGHSWSPTVGFDEDVVMVGGGGVLSDPDRDGSFSVTLIEGLVSDTEPPPYFCVGGGEDLGEPRKLFLFSKGNQVHVRHGAATSMAPISKPAADWTGGGQFPTFGCIHNQRMYVGGNASDPHRLYYSTLADHEDFTSTGTGLAGTIPIFPGQGEKLIGAYSIRGALIIWKFPVGIYVLATPEFDPTTWAIELLSRSVGGVNANSLIQIENDVIYMDHTGSIHSMRATNDFGDFNTSNVSELAKLPPFMKDEVNRSRIQTTQGLYYTNKRQAWFCVPRSNSVVPDLRLQLVFDAPDQQQAVPPRFFMSRRDVSTALWLRPSNSDGILKPTIGSQDGSIYTLDEDIRSKDGEAYEIRFSTANTDLAFIDPALATRHKTGQFLEIVYEPEGEWDLLVDTFWDDIYTETIAFNMGGAGGILGDFILGTDVLGASGIKESRRRVSGSGRRLRMTCSNDGLNQNVSLAEFHLSFVVGDERTPE